ncbi:hypothetical protein LCGC14_3122200, partial [marine sediment metagenome]
VRTHRRAVVMDFGGISFFSKGSGAGKAAALAIVSSQKQGGDLSLMV